MVRRMKRPLHREAPNRAVSLRELRTAHGLSQQRLAVAMEATQTRGLKAENTADPQLSTLRRYVEGIGAATATTAHLEVVAVVDGERFLIITTKGPREMGTSTLPKSGTAIPTAWRLRAWGEPAIEDRLLGESLIAI